MPTGPCIGSVRSCSTGPRTASPGTASPFRSRRRSSTSCSTSRLVRPRWCRRTSSSGRSGQTSRSPTTRSLRPSPSCARRSATIPRSRSTCRRSRGAATGSSQRSKPSLAAPAFPATRPRQPATQRRRGRRPRFRQRQRRRLAGMAVVGHRRNRHQRSARRNAARHRSRPRRRGDRPARTRSAGAAHRAQHRPGRRRQLSACRRSSAHHGARRRCGDRRDHGGRQGGRRARAGVRAAGSHRRAALGRAGDGEVDADAGTASRDEQPRSVSGVHRRTGAARVARLVAGGRRHRRFRARDRPRSAVRGGARRPGERPVLAVRDVARAQPAGRRAAGAGGRSRPARRSSSIATSPRRTRRWRSCSSAPAGRRKRSPPRDVRSRSIPATGATSSVWRTPRGAKSGCNALARAVELYPDFPFVHFEAAMVHIARGTPRSRGVGAARRHDRPGSAGRSQAAVSGEGPALAARSRSARARRRGRSAARVRSRDRAAVRASCTLPSSR